jgi:hypothetical protein
LYCIYGGPGGHSMHEADIKWLIGDDLFAKYVRYTCCVCNNYISDPLLIEQQLSCKHYLCYNCLNTKLLKEEEKGEPELKVTAINYICGRCGKRSILEKVITCPHQHFMPINSVFVEFHKVAAMIPGVAPLVLANPPSTLSA